MSKRGQFRVSVDTTRNRGMDRPRLRGVTAQAEASPRSVDAGARSQRKRHRAKGGSVTARRRGLSKVALEDGIDTAHNRGMDRPRLRGVTVSGDMENCPLWRHEELPPSVDRGKEPWTTDREQNESRHPRVR
jgi:hypothetical protein